MSVPRLGLGGERKRPAPVVAAGAFFMHGAAGEKARQAGGAGFSLAPGASGWRPWWLSLGRDEVGDFWVSSRGYKAYNGRENQAERF